MVQTCYSTDPEGSDMECGQWESDGPPYMVIDGCYDDGGTTTTPPPPPPSPPGNAPSPPASNPTPVDPCAQGKALAGNQNFVAKLNYLKTQATTPGETNYVMNADGTYTQRTDAANGGTNQNYPMSYFNNSVGFIHNHGQGAGILSVFSPADIGSLFNIISTGTGINASTYTYALVNQYGQSYLLSISSQSLFASWAATYMSNGATNGAFNSLYNSFVSPSNSAATNETNFVNLMTLTGTGLTLMKANANNNGWSQLVKNSDGTYSTIQCN